jgi:NAD(P)-dependent dehydrogenase (short-subunit alcohol dehydrogenase family)
VPRVFVTGANRGLGLEFVRQYARDGSTVIATCRDPDSADELQSLDGDITIRKLDVTSAHDVSRIVDELEGQPIDLLVSNAATLGGPRSRLRNLDAHDWREAFDTNVVGAIEVPRRLWPNVAASEGRTIVIVASRAGITRDAKPGGSYIYRSTKAALNTAARMMALDLQDEGVIVAMVNPGHVVTGIGGANAPMRVDESVTAMRDVISQMTMESTGKFWHYDGRELAL